MLLGLMGAALLVTAFSTLLPSVVSAASPPTSQADCKSSQYFEAANPVTNQPAQCVNKVDAPKSAADCPAGYIYQPVSTPPKCIITSAKACTSSQYFVPAKPVANQPAKCVNKVDNPRNAADCPSGYTYQAGTGTGTAIAQPATCVASAKACTSSQYFVPAKPAEGPIPPTAAKCVNKVDNPRNAADCPSGYTYQAAFGTNGATCMVNTTTQTGGCTNGTDSSGNCNSDSKDALDCGAGALNWIVCSVISAAQDAAGKLDAFITDQLKVDVAGTFEKGPTANGYYTAWNSFRVLATALIVIAGLLMVVSQALGFEALDAYTVRKTLPRLLVAVIGISLSWPVMDFVVKFFDVLGQDIGNLIYAPFNGLVSNIGVQAGLATIFGSVALALALGFASLTFILTGLLAMFVAFLTLIIRQIAIVILIIVAPIAIACYILPGTQKVWQLWRENFLGLMMMFPIIIAFISAGHVFSAVALQAGQGTSPSHTVEQLIGILAYFIPYFLLPMAFRMATGAVANIAGMVNDAHKGAFDRLKNRRSNALNSNMAKMKAGSRFNPNSRLTRALGGNIVNRTGAHVGAGAQGRFGFGATGAAARGNNAFSTKESMAKENAAFGAQAENEDAMIAVAMGNDRRKLAQLSHFRNKDGSLNEAKLDAALAAGRSIGSDQRTQVAALDALSKSGKVIGNREELDTVLDSVSRGNQSLRGGLKGSYQFNSRQVGRNDIGRSSGYETVRELDASTIGRLKPKAAENIFAAGGDWEQAFQAADSDEARQHMVDELYAAQYSPNLSPEVHDHLNGLIGRMPGLLTSDGGMHGVPQMVGGAPVINPTTGKAAPTGANYWEEAARRYGAKYSNPRSPGGPSGTTTPSGTGGPSGGGVPGGP